MKKLKNLLKMGALIAMATVGGCSAGQKENKSKEIDPLEQERKEYFGLTKEEFKAKFVPKEEALSRIQYHKSPQNSHIKSVTETD